MKLTILISLLALVLYTILSVRKRIAIARMKRHMETENGTERKKVATIREVPPGVAKKFWLVCGNKKIDGFLVHFSGSFYAYANLCRHMETPLDWIDNRFFSEDGRFLYCGTHGARYEPDTGKCVSGPCKGLSLYSLSVDLIGQDVLVKCPQGDLAPYGG